MRGELLTVSHAATNSLSIVPTPVSCHTVRLHRTVYPQQSRRTGMSLKVKVVCALEAEGLLKEPKRRRHWVNPMNSERETGERFEKFYQDVTACDKRFFDYYRMTKASFEELLEVLRPHISKQNTQLRRAISPEERLTITIRYLSTGNTFSNLQYEFFIARSTIGTIVKETCQAIWTHLKEMEMPEPTEEMWLDVANQFYEKTNFPNCVGAVDGKHVRCINPRAARSKLVKYKNFYSVVLMAVADANLRFVVINVSAYGNEGDSSVFRESPLGRNLYSDTLSLPPPRCLPGTSENPQPFVMVGDEAFNLSTNLLRPYPTHELNATRRVFNYRLSRCRRNVECAFGVLANKWRIFHTPILVQTDFIDEIIQACCILHNFVRKRDGVNDEDGETYPFMDVDDFGPFPHGRGLETRDYFASYFMGPGAVPFQKNHMY